jgi:beta-N-acetylhexosaminidase
MTAHIVYPQIDPEHPATLSHKVLTGVLRDAIAYDGVVITDALMMKAVHERYGHARASVLTLQAGADLVLAQGARAEQLAAVQAIAAALQTGALDAAALQQARARVDSLAARFPLRTTPYSEAQEAADRALMLQAWTRGLTAVGNPVPPARTTPLRVITQASVVSDGVSEAGLPLDQVQALFAGFDDVALWPVANLCELDVDGLPRDGRCNVLVSNHHGRYQTATDSTGVDLHLAIWNPFQVLDIHAPAIVTWGYAEGATAALKAWLQGNVSAAGVAPVALKPA